MRFLLLIFSLMFFRLLFAIDYFLGKDELLQQDSPIIKSLLYFGQQGNMIYFCSKNIDMADELNQMVLLMVQNNIQYEFECERNKLNQEDVLVNFYP